MSFDAESTHECSTMHQELVKSEDIIRPGKSFTGAASHAKGHYVLDPFIIFCDIVFCLSNVVALLSAYLDLASVSASIAVPQRQ
jgi:hypothetical protein